MAEKWEEKYKKDPEHYNKKIFGTQKIKLYKLKHWIFDFAGVMAETPNIVKNLIEIINADLGTSISKEDTFLAKNRRRLSSGRIDAREFLELILENYYYPSQKKDSALPPKKVNLEYYLALWFELYSKVTQISPNMEEIVERLHKAGYTVSLMSNTYGIHVKSNKLKGFFDLFDQCFLSNELHLRKPDIEKYKYVLKKLGAKGKECIFIDDKLMNLVPARKLGIFVIRFKSFEKFKKYLGYLGIQELEDDLFQKIQSKYKQYKTSEKELKRLKKDYESAKKKFKKLKKNKWKEFSKYRKAKKALNLAEEAYKNQKYEYKELKQIKKN
ncbi:MAG: HAD family hydrolase, partial [Promethearchaeota archaeon]